MGQHHLPDGGAGFSLKGEDSLLTRTRSDEGAERQASGWPAGGCELPGRQCPSAGRAGGALETLGPWALSRQSSTSRLLPLLPS